MRLPAHCRAALVRRLTTSTGLVAVVTATIVLLLTAPVLGFDWLMFDDDINILLNPHLGGGAGTVPWAFQNIDYIRRYLPLGWIGFETLLTIDGYNATVFHTASWLLSGLNAALMFFVITRLLQLSCPGEPAREPVAGWVAAIAALGWSLHPLRAEHAGWISGLLYLGNAAFASGALLVHLSSDARRAGAIAWRQWLGSLLYLAALLVYPAALSLPALLTWRAGCLARDGDRLAAARREALALAGWWAAAAGCLAINVAARLTSGGLFETASPGHALAPLTVAKNALLAAAHYIASTLWPAEVAIVYGPAETWIAPGALAGIAILIVVALLWKKTRRPALGWGVAGVLALLPFLTVYEPSFQPNDRYAVLWLAVWAVALALALFHRQRGRALTLSGATLVVVFLAVRYHHALHAWRDTPTLQAVIDRATAAHPDPKLSFSRPAMIAWLHGDHREMKRRLRLGRERFPGMLHLVETELQLAELDDRWNRRVGGALHVTPLAILHFDHGRIWRQRGHPRAAAAHFARALELAPRFGDAHRALAAAQKELAPAP